MKSLFSKLQGHGLAARARRGTIFTIIQFGGSNVVRLLSNLLLTRLLFPESFGLMALVQVVIAGLRLFSDFGVKASIVQHARGDDPTFLNTAWTVNALRGLILALIVFVAAPYIAEFYEEPTLQSLLRVAALVLIIDGCIPVKVFAAGRNLILGRLTILNFCTQVTTLVITLVLAWILQSVWALVIGQIIGSLLNNSMSRIFIPGLPDRFRLEWDALRDILHFGGFLLLSSAATFIINNGDRAILGKLVELELLGVYTIAFTMASQPMLVVRMLGQRIVFPLYSRRPPHENEDNRRQLFKARYLLTGVAFCTSLLLIVFGDAVIRFLYDARYDLAGPMTVVIVVGLLPVLIVTSYDSILMSRGRSDLHAVMSVSRGLLSLMVLYVGISNYGILGAALAPAIATLLHYPIMVGLTYRYRAWDPVHDLVFAALTCGICVLCWSLHEEIILALLTA